jgi:hypothetical protein
MDFEQLLSEIRRLTLDERLAVLEALSHEIRQSLRSPTPSTSSLERVRGLLRTDTPLQGADDSDSYVDYLLKKYS